MSTAQVQPGYKLTEVGVIPEEWEVKPLGDLAHIQRGASPRPIDDPRWFDNNSSVGWVRITDVTRSNMFLSETSQRLSALGIQHSRPIARGSLIMSICATVGRPIITDIEACIHDGFVVFENLQANKQFVYHVLKSIEGEWSKRGQIGSQMNLNTGLIKSTKIAVPPLPEQRAIAEALGDVDALLAALERLIAKQRAVKQAAMDALLSGRVRLPGFGQGVGYRQTEVGEIPEDWEVRRIGELFDFLSTSSCSRADLDENGDVFYIHYGDIHTKWNYKLNFDQETVPRIGAEKVQNADFLHDGDLILVDASEDEEGAGKGIEIVNLRGRRAVAGLHTIALRPKGNELADGFKAYIQAMRPVKSQIRRLVTGLKVFGISKSSIEGVAVPLPPLPEQRAIAEVLSDMDAAIAALERQRAKVQAIKQGMMAELLTGRVRLVGAGAPAQARQQHRSDL